MQTSQSEKLFKNAQELMPGGVNSPVRSFKSVGGTPRFMSNGEGAYVFDADGNRYLDFTASWGPLIHGHAHPKVVGAIKIAAETGTSFGTPTDRESMLAEMVIDRIPSIQKVRFVNSGTEATMSAVRLARAFTGRDIIVKFEGCYHGHGDLFLSDAGSGLATLDQPASPGIPQAVVESTITLPFNDLESVLETFQKHGDKIAAVILEPIAGNMGVIPPKSGFLERLRSVTENSGALLIFDEVITGFRAACGGAQELFGIAPDLTTLGKIIGGGLPVGAYGGRADIMAMIAPEGPVYQAGTLSGNPLSMAAGIATLELLDDPSVYQNLDQMGEKLEHCIMAAAEESGVPLTVNRCGSMLSLFFSNQDMFCFEDVKSSNTDLFPKFHFEMMENGLYLPPSAYETFFVSTVHTDAQIDEAVNCFQRAFEKFNNQP